MVADSIGNEMLKLRPVPLLGLTVESTIAGVFSCYPALSRGESLLDDLEHGRHINKALKRSSYMSAAYYEYPHGCTPEKVVSST
jgi:hypothetical protein